jgi:hypothetical protein
MTAHNGALSENRGRKRRAVQIYGSRDAFWAGFRGESRGIIGRRKFGVRKFFTLKPSGADRAPGSVIRGPHHLKELVLLVRHDLLARLKRFDGNNVATLKSRSSLEVATDVSHVLYESLFAKQATAAVDPRDFRGNIYCNGIFSSSLDFNHFSHGL